MDTVSRQFDIAFPCKKAVHFNRKRKRKDLKKSEKGTF